MPFRFRVRSRGALPWSTHVVVAPGALALAAAEISRGFPLSRKIVVADARVARLYGRSLTRRLSRGGAGEAALLTFPSGERSKTRETKSRLEDRLLELGVGRDAVLVALGGGVTGDLAGFLAATWHRGIPVVSIPTTVLAMVDAALGGKTGVDLPDAKNVVGAFHQPVSVWADVRLLRTLPARTYRAGLAEAVKIAVACDAALFARLETDAARLKLRDERIVERVVARCLALKGRIVASDERDAGRRAVLNFGHTAAHALEAAADFRIEHGEAVSIGVVVEARIAERVTGLPHSHADRIEALLRALGLPVRPQPGLDARRLELAMRRDKKTRSGIVRCALPERIGRMPAGADPTRPVEPARDLLPWLLRN